VSKRRFVNPRCGLARLLLNPRVVTRFDGGATTLLRQDSRSGMLRSLTERRTDFGFLDGLVSALSAEGFTAAEAWDALAVAVNNPAVALRRSRAHGGSDLLQATAVERAGEPRQRSLLVLTAAVTADKPPNVRDAAVRLLHRDWADREALAAVAEQLEIWRREYRFIPGLHSEHLEHTWAWLGDPAMCGYQAIPPNWEEEVRFLGAVFGLRTLVARSPGDAKGQNLEQRIHLGVHLNGARGAWQRLPDEVLARWAVDRLGQPGSTFAELLGEVRQLLVEDLLLRLNETRHAPRALKPGEVVYHRKVSPQPSGYDRFDEGRPDPCGHGADSFRRWNGEKSRKGMARLYTNFAPNMLYHCSHYPNCGVYCVRHS
jgi:hypothetical protein